MTLDAWSTRDPDTDAGPVIDTRSLADAIEVECRLLGELRAVLQRQREGIARDDLEVVDESVVAAHRVMHTLGEARRRRRALVGFLAPAEDTPLDELDTALGPRMTPELAGVRTRLHDEAHGVAREIEINRRVLSAALDHGDRFIHALCGAAPAGYDRSSQQAITAQSGVLIDQQA